MSDSAPPPPQTPHSDDLRSLSLVDLATAIREGRVTSEHAVTVYLDHIEAVNPKLNAVVQLRREGAIADARAADQAPPDVRVAHFTAFP